LDTISKEKLKKDVLVYSDGYFPPAFYGSENYEIFSSSANKKGLVLEADRR